jgi:hypothetical protein
MMEIRTPDTEIPPVETLAAAPALLRPYQREHLAKEIRQLEWALRGASEHDGSPMPQFAQGLEPPDYERLQESLHRNRETLTRHDPENSPFNEVQKNKLYRLLRDTLEPEITHHMPSHEMMERPTAGNISHWRAWHEQQKKNMLARRRILRLLDPKNNDPYFVNISMLRTSDPPKGDPRKFWQGFEAIKFDEAMAAEANQLTDDQYYQFLLYKAQEWSAPSICKALGWSKGTYTQAMHRLRDAVPVTTEPEPAPVVVPASEEDDDLPTAPEMPTDDFPMDDGAGVPMGQRFGPWLNEQMQARGIVKRSLQQAMGIAQFAWQMKLNGRRPTHQFTPFERQQALDLLSAFDQDPSQSPLRLVQPTAARR